MVDGPNCNARNLPNIQHGFPSHALHGLQRRTKPFFPFYEIIDANTVTRAHSQISDEGMQRTHHNINSDTRSLSSSACFFREVYVHVMS